AQTLNAVNAALSSPAPLQVAPKSVMIFLTTIGAGGVEGVGEGAGDGEGAGSAEGLGGAELPAAFPPREIVAPELDPFPPLVAIQPEPFPVTVVPVSRRTAFDPCA